MQKAFTCLSFTRLNSHEKFFTSLARPFCRKYCSVAAAIFFPTRVTMDAHLEDEDLGAVCMYSLYWVRLEESTSWSDTSKICRRPVSGTVPHPERISIEAKRMSNFFIAVYFSVRQLKFPW